MLININELKRGAGAGFWIFKFSCERAGTVPGILLWGLEPDYTLRGGWNQTIPSGGARTRLSSTNVWNIRYRVLNFVKVEFIGGCLSIIISPQFPGFFWDHSFRGLFQISRSAMSTQAKGCTHQVRFRIRRYPPLSLVNLERLTMVTQTWSSGGLALTHIQFMMVSSSVELSMPCGGRCRL